MPTFLVVKHFDFPLAAHSGEDYDKKYQERRRNLFLDNDLRSKGAIDVFTCRAFNRHAKARTRLVVPLVLLVSQWFAVGGRAAEPEFVGILALAVEDDIAERIDLSEDTHKALVDLIDRREAEAINLALELRSLPPAERAQRLKPFVEESERLGLALLSDAQQKKLRQLRVAREGLATLSEPEIAQQIQLTDAQKTQIATILSERATALTRGNETDQRLARAEFERRLASVLTDSQRTAWQKLAGLLEETDQLAQASAPDNPPPVSNAVRPPMAPADPAPPLPPASVTPSNGAPLAPQPTESIPDTAASPTDNAPTPQTDRREPAAPPTTSRPSATAIPAEDSATPPTDSRTHLPPGSTPNGLAAPNDNGLPSQANDRAPVAPAGPGAAPNVATPPAANFPTPPTGARAPAPPLPPGSRPIVGPADNLPTQPSNGRGQVAPLPPGSTPTPAAGATDNTPAPQSDGGAPRENAQLRFNFRYAPWKDVIEWFAQQANLSVEGEAPTGTFNYTDNRTYTPAEAIDLLNSVLLTKGFTLLRRDRMLFVVDLESLEGGIPPNLVTRVSPEELDERGEYEIVSVLFPLTTMTTEEAEAEIRPLLGRPGEMVILPRSKQVWVTGTAGRLKTIRRVLETVEKPDATKNLNKFKVEHVSPEEVLTVTRKLMGIPDDANGAEDGSIRFTADPLSNHIYVGGQPEAIKRFEEILKMVDVEPSSPVAGAGALESPQLEVYPVTDVDPTTALQVMQTLLAGLPGVRLATDPATGNLIALARPAEHATIRATLAQLQKETRQITVLQLQRLDPQLAVVSINRMFGGGTETPNPKAPVVDADPISGMLLVRGTQTQVEQIKGLLRQMGEAPETLEGAVGRTTLGSPLGGGNIRVLPLTGRAARDVLEQMELLWPTMRENRIRIVRPSTTIDARRLNQEAPSFRGLPQEFDEEDDSPAEPSLENNPRGTRTAPQAPQPADREAALNTPGRAAIHKVVINAAGVADNFSSPELANIVVPARRTPGGTPTSTSVGHRGENLSSGQVFPVGERSDQQSTPVRFAVEQNLLAQAGGNVTPQRETPSPESGNKEPAEIIVRVTPNGLIVASEDLEALDDFETLLRTLSESSVLGGAEYTVFYLKYVQAPVAAELLTQLLTGAPPADDGGAVGGGLMGSLMSAALGNAGGGLVSSLLGGGGSTTSTFSTTGLNIVAEPRLNALVVQGSPQQLDMIEQLLKVIDQESSPEVVQTLPPPRMIPVFNTSAENIANTVRQIYAQQIASGGGQQRQPSPEDFIRALRGGGERAGRRAEQAVQQMTISVDTRSNSLVVSAPDPLFASVKALVEALDQPGLESPQSTQVVSIQGANAAVVRQALTSVLGDVIKTNTGSTTNGGSSSQQRQETSRQPSSNDSREQIRQRMEFFNALQRGIEGGRGGGRGSGGFGGGGFGGGSRGSGGGGGRRGR